MTPLRRLLSLAVAGALLATASCGGDGESLVEPDPETFDLLTGCSADCVSGFMTMIDGFDNIMMWLASGADAIEGDRFLNLETGAFGFDLDMDGRSGDEIQFRGTIAPLSRCSDGMVKGDVCIAEWDMWHVTTGARTGEGTFSVVGLGNVGSPEPTPSFRVTIVTENPWFETEEGCRLEITALQLITHPFDEPQLMSALISFKMTSTDEAIVDEVTGDLIYAYDPSATSQSMTLTGQYTVGGTPTNISCTVNLDTFAVSCS